MSANIDDLYRILAKQWAKKLDEAIITGYTGRIFADVMKGAQPRRWDETISWRNTVATDPKPTSEFTIEYGYVVETNLPAKYLEIEGEYREADNKQLPPSKDE